MNTSLRLSSLLVLSTAFGLLAGCAAPTSESEPESPASSEEGLASSKVKLPKGDDCRDVLSPLALALADGAVGTSYTKSITVSLTSETDTRLYTVLVEGRDSSIQYEVELDNDSHSKCFIEGIRVEPKAKLSSEKRTATTNAERYISAPISVTPKNDDCASTVKLLAQAVAVSAVGAKFIERVDVTLVGETEDRDYVAHVDGKSFVANGRTFPNDYDFILNVSNDSAFKCFVQQVSIKGDD